MHTVSLFPVSSVTSPCHSHAHHWCPRSHHHSTAVPTALPSPVSLVTSPCSQLILPGFPSGAPAPQAQWACCRAPGAEQICRTSPGPQLSADSWEHQGQPPPSPLPPRHRSCTPLPAAPHCGPSAPSFPPGAAPILGPEGARLPREGRQRAQPRPPPFRGHRPPGITPGIAVQ